MESSLFTPNTGFGVFLEGIVTGAHIKSIF